MAYSLGGVTLRNPKSLKRTFVETSKTNTLFNNTSTRKIVNRKEIFVLQYQNLTQLEINSLLALWDLETPLVFTVNEPNLSIGPTDVLMELERKNTPLFDVAGYMREDIIITLNEII